MKIWENIKSYYSRYAMWFNLAVGLVAVYFVYNKWFKK